MWPVEVDLKFLEPVGKELKMLGKVKRHDMLFAFVSESDVFTCANVIQYLRGHVKALVCLRLVCFSKRGLGFSISRS